MLTFHSVDNGIGHERGSNLVIADFDNDGVLDIVAHGGPDTYESGPEDDVPEQFLFFRGKRDGAADVAQLFEPPIIVQTHLEIVNNFAAADLNDDGNADLVAAAAGREGEAAKLTTQIMLGHGDGTFDEPQVYHAGAEDVSIADLNGDGVLDLAVTRDSGTDTVQALAAFIGRGDGTFHDPETHALIEPYPAVDIDAADLDGDRRADVVVTVGQYSGSRGAVTLLAAKPGLQDAASGDVNGDGYLDLLAANAANGMSNCYWVRATTRSIGNTIFSWVEARWHCSWRT